MSNPKNSDKIPALIVFGRIRGSKVDQAAVFLEKDAEAAKKAASDAGLSALEVQTEADRDMAAALPEGAINAQGRFSLSPASPEIIAELERLLKAATGQEATSARSAKSETASATISADLWRQLKPGPSFLLASFDIGNGRHAQLIAHGEAENGFPDLIRRTVAQATLQEADHQGRSDDQSPKRHRERVQCHRSDRRVDSRRDADVAAHKSRQTRTPRYRPRLIESKRHFMPRELNQKVN